MTMMRAKTKKGVHEPSPVLVIEPPFEELIATVEMCKVNGNNNKYGKSFGHNCARTVVTASSDAVQKNIDNSLLSLLNLEAS